MDNGLFFLGKAPKKYLGSCLFVGLPPPAVGFPYRFPDDLAAKLIGLRRLGARFKNARRESDGLRYLRYGLPGFLPGLSLLPALDRLSSRSAKDSVPSTLYRSASRSKKSFSIGEKPPL